MANSKKSKHRAGKNQPSRSAARSGSSGGKGFYLLLAGLVVAGAAALVLARDTGGGDAPVLAPLSVAETTAPASADAGVAIGPPDAPVTIAEFADFLCPYCRTFNSVVGKALRRDFAGPDGPVRWINYDFPLHQTSWAPALAARCAEQQGRYWQMHDLLYAMSDDWNREANPNGKFVEIAETAGVDKDAFRTCLENRSGLQEIGAARRYGESLGVNSTPSLFINGRSIPATREFFSYAGLEKLIQQELAAATTGSE
ncbi:MAG: DsbA family protein [Gemmatimonadota bacterium]|nr:DsbA family protein [Gemmatimonadota bacterium]MDH3427194.1 DsbA family protein [Gemmatimonadota bacterium]